MEEPPLRRLPASSAQWRQYRGPDATALYLVRSRRYQGTTEVAIRLGTPDGRVRPCDQPALAGKDVPIERCEVVVATSLSELGDAIFRSGFSRRRTLLDSEPAVAGGKRAYEYPAHGGQSVVYVVAMHGTQPVVVRLWSVMNPASPALTRS